MHRLGEILESTFPTSSFKLLVVSSSSFLLKEEEKGAFIYWAYLKELEVTSSTFTIQLLAGIKLMILKCSNGSTLKELQVTSSCFNGRWTHEFNLLSYITFQANMTFGRSGTLCNLRFSRIRVCVLVVAGLLWPCHFPAIARKGGGCNIRPCWTSFLRSY